MHGFLGIVALSAVVVGLGVSTRCPIPARATSAELAFSPSSASVAVSANVAVDITVANVTNLGGYDVYLQFNPSRVHLASLSDAAFVTSGGNIVVCNPATIDNSAGTATDSCGTIAPFGTPGPGVSTVAPKALMHASFAGVAPAASSLTLTGTALQDPFGAPIPATLGVGSIAVTASVGGSAGLPDVSASPSQTRGARSSTPPYLPMTLGIGLLAIVVVGVVYAAGVWRRSRIK